ncbi:hypothetical protein DPX16_21865 [Anabarilius grahami]|uniref:Uncharacterized protein n=1 Tax=Anabarilius grahami TaxID=495550 RepID=A0A3N0YC89_ANAGA|nr:hypothetical protein DPX16_21865 [Anabarilius grahami]
MQFVRERSLTAGNPNIRLSFIDLTYGLSLETLPAKKYGLRQRPKSSSRTAWQLPLGSHRAVSDSIPFGQQPKLNFKRAFLRGPTEAAKASGTSFSEEKVVPLRECGQETKGNVAKEPKGTSASHLEGNEVTPNATREADLVLLRNRLSSGQPCLNTEPLKRILQEDTAARREARPKHTAARIHQPEERSPPDAMTSNTNVIVIRSLSPAPGKLRENKTFSNFPTSSSTSPMIAATVKPQHKQGPEPPGRDADSSSLGKSAKREQSKQQTNTQQCPQALCMRAPLQTENAQKNMYIKCQTLGHG